MGTYRQRVANIIHEQGFRTFIRKAFYSSVDRIRLKIDLKVFAGFYIRGFHRLYYNSSVRYNTLMLGVKTDKCPLDLWIYQEMIYETKPDVIIETGTNKGGSTLFFASVCELIDHGQVITVDVEDYGAPSHPRITKILGNSVSEEVVKTVEGLVNGKRAMVVLDSAHNKEHVLKEMELYGPLVSRGCYLTVEDTNVNGHPVFPEYGPGPMEAVEEFMRENEDFVIDPTREKFMLTFFPKGFLKRIR